MNWIPTQTNKEPMVRFNTLIPVVTKGETILEYPFNAKNDSKGTIAMPMVV
jgi:hypothetical protein